MKKKIVKKKCYRPILTRLKAIEIGLKAEQALGWTTVRATAPVWAISWSLYMHLPSYGSEM